MRRLSTAVCLAGLVASCRAVPDEEGLQREVDALREQNAALLTENHAVARRLAVPGGLRLYFPPGDFPGAPLEARLRRLERENELLRQDWRRMNERFQHLVGGDEFGGPTQWVPDIDTVVLEVSGDGTVVLGAGAEELVEVGHAFDVYRGSTYCGQVRVERVEDHRCLARIENLKSPIAVGDAASTRL